jgi:hypothetical protein
MFAGTWLKYYYIRVQRKKEQNEDKLKNLLNGQAFGKDKEKLRGED